MNVVGLPLTCRSRQVIGSKCEMHFSDFKCKLDGKELGREDINALMPIFSLIENL